MRQRDNGFYKYYTQYNIQYKSFRNALSRCHTVTRRIDSLVSTLSNYEESIAQYRSGIGVVKGKTAGNQDKRNNPHNRYYFIRLCGLLFLDVTVLRCPKGYRTLTEETNTKNSMPNQCHFGLLGDLATIQALARYSAH